MQGKRSAAFFSMCPKAERASGTVVPKAASSRPFLDDCVVTWLDMAAYRAGNVEKEVENPQTHEALNMSPPVWRGR